MTTAALANTEEVADSSNTTTTNNNDTSTNNINNNNAAQQQLKKTAQMARGLADDASRAIGNLLPTASLQTLTTRKYTLPDKTVASQVLMYRQLLHTKCRPGLKLSRPYQATPAQKAVMHMPWWEEGIEESKKMIISYDNLITRLWLNGAIEPYREKQPSSEAAAAAASADLLDGGGEEGTVVVPSVPAPVKETETFINELGLPPVPHTYWVERLGFQQPDPVTDFRSGGVLSLAMMVYMVESKPKTCQRFFSGDASVLPFGITCINVADMIAKFLMLAKSTDRMDALLSQKPFWRMFADPNAILAVQDIAMGLLCDVVVELGKERKIPLLAKQHSSHQGDQLNSDQVTVFDFSTILERTERRVRDDLLGAGPKTVDELRSVAGRLRIKYQTQLDRRIQRAQQQQQQQAEGGRGSSALGIASPPQMKDVMDKTSNMVGAVAGGLFAKMKTANTGFANSFRKDKPAAPTTTTTTRTDSTTESSEPAATIVDLPPPLAATLAPAAAAPEPEGDWVGTDIAPASDAISNFSIGDDDDDDDIL